LTGMPSASNIAISRFAFLGTSSPALAHIWRHLSENLWFSIRVVSEDELRALRHRE
jgi:hypothetical protein